MGEHLRLNTANHARIGVPTALLGVLASAFGAAPATAAVPASDRHHAAADTGSLQRLAAVPRVLPMRTSATSYVVQPGDTVASIAARHGLSTVDVLTWNGLGWRTVIYPGQTLTLAASAAPAPAAALAPAPAAAPAASTTHTVVAGDTVYAIAQQHATSVDAVLSANGLSRDSIIYPGQSLVVSGTAAPATPAPAAAPAAPSAASAQPASAASAHVVVAGDTLFGIAQKYGTSVDVLYAANSLEPASIIYPGQSIAIAAKVAASPATAAPTADLNAPQAENAALIISIGRELGVSDRGIAIALATSMVESWLRNLDWGDRDSLGLFQQRPSTGWGTADQVKDRQHAIRSFYLGASDANGKTTRGLLDIPGWESMPFSDAAQAVQISAYPDRYGQWEDEAYRWLALYG